MKTIIPATIPPITRSPQVSIYRRIDPQSRYPVIIVPVVSPIARYPQISIIGAFRLCIIGQSRWGMMCPDHDSYSDTCICRFGRGHKGKHEEKKYRKNFNCFHLFIGLFSVESILLNYCDANVRSCKLGFVTQILKKVVSFTHIHVSKFCCYCVNNVVISRSKIFVCRLFKQ